jgi:hypothetical protein
MAPLTMFLPFNYYPYSLINRAPKLLCDLEIVHKKDPHIQGSPLLFIK